ncbi:FtsX-like permease family protein [Chitinispirillales bacterium ANBcel5]|uniref:ABC transporter permease n=1 Tax=Cellulosispirillum alkaliphilum TaxID=3039283 RepID=UPI002A56DCBA|nr:FtsX-like permease family protein [Chitinispirillales bacterium ANBcel5]
MVYILKLALRNVMRNRRRTFLAAVSVAISVSLILVMQGMLGGFLSSIVLNYTKNQTGHIRISTDEFKEKQTFAPVTENIDSHVPVLESIKNNPDISPYIELITERVQVQVLLSNEGNNRGAVVLGVNPDTERNLMMLDRSIIPGGRYLENERDMILGIQLATAMGFKVGDSVSVVTQASDYSLNMRKFVISGLFETGLNMLDESVMQVDVEDARILLKMDNSTQQIIIMLNDYRKADFLAGVIEKSLGRKDLSVVPWTKIGDYANYVTMAQNMYSLVYIVVALLGAFIIGNIMMMVVMERRREIGILKSMGLKHQEIVTLFLVEGTIMGFLGSVMGMILGGSIVTWMHLNGVDFSSITGSLNMPLDNVIYFSIEISNFFKVAFLAVGVSALVSLGPSRRASKMSAVETMKSAY